MTCPSKETLIWDIFCHVIDNWGDLGVCWRLTRNLQQSGQKVRLWSNEIEALDWMAPGARHGGYLDITVHHWSRDPAEIPPPVLPGDVLIEGFGCDIAPQWIEQLQPTPHTGQHQRLWLNLEYLSAERYVARCHGLRSPIMSGRLQGRDKWFFYPGFTPNTGGLLRETDLLRQQQHFDAVQWAEKQQWSPYARRVTLFCYEPAQLPDLLCDAALTGAHWCVAPGRPAQAFQAAIHHCPDRTPTHHILPYLPQTEFDHLLWSSDLNLVRGEDSLVRALWAGQAFVWHIYPQEDNAHHAKLEAFLDWLDAPASLRAFHRVWNGMHPARLPPVDLAAWQACTLTARQRLLQQDDLVQQLLAFVMEKR